MPQPEPDNLSFVVRIWVEERLPEGAEVLWRGHITHVQSGERKYFEQLDVVQHFIHDYCRELGIEVEPPQQTWGWLRRVQRLIERVRRR